jgi:hypothetical protein
MKLQQLSVFLENKPGQLHHACQLLADAKINITTLSLADTKDYGILRLVLKEWQQAKTVMEQAGFVVKVTDVLAVEVDDRPGGLAKILAAVEKANLNVDYMYAFASGAAGKAVLVFRFEDADAAVGQLKSQGVNLVDGVTVFGK